MKTKKLVRVALLALACAPLAAAPLCAAPFPYVEGDLFMGFRTALGSQSYLIDIGQGTYFRDLAPGVYNLNSILGIANLDADLDSLFPNWELTGSSVLWGVAGKYDSLEGNTNVLFAARKETTIGTIATPWTSRVSSLQGTQVGKITNLAGGALNDFEGVTANNSRAIISNNTDVNDWSEFMAGNGGSTGSQTSSNVAFSTWQSSTFEGGFGASASGTRLDLFYLPPSVSGTVNGSYEGTFAIDSNANLTFTVTPEPSSAVLLGLSGCLIGFVRRRKIATT